MARQIWILGIVVGGVTWLAWSQRTAQVVPEPAPPRPEPSALQPEFSERNVYLGDFPWNSRIPFALQLVNRSAKPVRIATIQKSCGCTELNEDDIVGLALQPRDTLTLNGVIQANEHLGVQHQTIELMLESGLMRTAELEYELYRTYKVTPTAVTIRVQRSALDDPSAYAPQIVFASDLGVGLRDIRSTAPWLATARRELTDGTVEVSVLLRRALVATGRNEATIIIETDDALRPLEAVRVLAIVQAAVISNPARVFLRPGQSATVEVFRQDGAALNVNGVKCDSPNVKVSVQANRVIVSRGESANPTSASSPVVVNTSNGETCEIPVLFLE